MRHEKGKETKRSFGQKEKVEPSGFSDVMPGECHSGLSDSHQQEKLFFCQDIEGRDRGFDDGGEPAVGKFNRIDRKTE